MRLKLALLSLVPLLLAEAPETAHIVGMYSEKSRPGLGGHFLMKVDGKKVANLRYPTYYRLTVPPGVYDISLEDKDQPPILCHLIAGESCYVRARTTGPNALREVALISPHEAAVQLQKLLPLENEKVYIRVWK